MGPAPKKGPLPPVDPRQLQHFLALLEARSFKVAAERLGLTQSALTKSLQRLEQQLNCRLFDRTTRSVVPTAAAEQLSRRAEEALLGLDAFGAAAAAIASGGTATVRIGAIALSTESIVTPALVRMSQSHPQIQVELVVGSADVYGDLAAGRCDAVVGDQINFQLSSYAESMRIVPLQTETLVAVYRCEHPAAKQPDLGSFMSFPWAIPSRYFAENSSLQGLVDRVSGQTFPHYRMTSLAACLSMSKATDVVTLAPLSVAQTQVAQGLCYDDLGLDLRVRLALFTLARLSPGAGVRALQEALLGSVGEGSAYSEQSF